ncbi:helix-turn-helix domain-containing protein [Alkanindiges illinoisensis]|uniref:helix-turn-helix domain-containing protein n=1 Tax=Alkanindiges illinoisensis TaxID=197183 RepID=UPI00047E9F50|nr:helix-turn-helix domain-containing protein [Alkanindiges illinoisensis]
MNERVDNFGHKETAAYKQPNQWPLRGDSHTQAAQDLPVQAGLERRQCSTITQAVKPNSSLSREAQEQRVLEMLQSSGSGLNRFEADALLNVCHLAARIKGLKDKGHCFTTVYGEAFDLNGRPHPRVARYFWRGFNTGAANDALMNE